jgi:arylsulfatase A-like enzyme
MIRTYIMLVLMAMVCLSCMPVSTVKSVSDTRPNIIVIMGDDMGYSDIGCYGSEIKTPTLDSLAKNGLRYTSFYNTGRCCPTRASLMSGLYAHQAGVGRMMGDDGVDGYRGEFSHNAVSIAEFLKTAGYRTYMAGKWHITKETRSNGKKINWPRQRGFDRFYGTIHGAGSFFDPNTLTRDNTFISPENDHLYKPKEYYYTDAISDNSVMFINDHNKKHSQQPFLMYVSYTAAHWPMHALEKDIAKYKGHYDAGYESIRKARYEKMIKIGSIENWALSKAPRLWKDCPEKEKAWELRCMEVYAAMIDSMDQGIGRIVSTLKKNGQFDNTLILFFQDNGGCHESYGRGGQGNKETDIIPMAKDELQRRMVPRRSRDGRPVKMGKSFMPGPTNTFIAYGMYWANVSNTPFREYKTRNHEGGISTPLIAHWPKGIKGKNEWRHQTGHLIDIMATCVELSKTSYPKKHKGHTIKPLEGMSLVNSFNSKKTVSRQLIWEHYQNKAIRQGKWKLVSLSGRPWELYDMEKDRSELNNLVKSDPKRAKDMQLTWEKEAHRTMVYPLPLTRAQRRERAKKIKNSK